ncbi:MAG: SUMF1/EgtB/PvdO family nonheme iron enzyme [Saprospiraceae bacterium]|nr:SUMF1/EgtB/PvdO family nonheme iron enzyme [Saprospiraceae bacterium]
MKKSGFLLIGLIALILSSCGSSSETGELVGVMDRPSWNGINPYGMVYIPSGTLHIGQSDQDVFSTYVQRPKAISIQGFYMDDTEITNNEYRQFVNWVRDSIAHTILGDFYEDDYGNEILDWELPIDWQDEILEDMYYQGDMAFDGMKEFDIRQFNYKYQWIDWNRAANNKDVTRTSLINEHEENIYPDTLCWIRDFSYSANEPMTRNYFWHPAYDDYPLVGINWPQAKAFTHWRTKLWNQFKSADQPNTESFRLPTEAEWEYAARGGHDMAPFPWGGYYVRNAKGCLLANFKPGRGNYPEDGGLYTVKADAYFPNDYGLYCMAGNVSEWTETAFHENAYQHEHDLNPDYKYNADENDPESYKRKVIRGGSWKDISYYMHTGTRNWEFQDTSKSYIGFRCALTFLGRSINDF